MSGDIGYAAATVLGLFILSSIADTLRRIERHLKRDGEGDK